MSPPTPTLVFGDGEMTGLDSDVHEMWECALIVRGHSSPELDGEWCWQLNVDTSKADRKSLEIGRFAERYLHPTEVYVTAMPGAARDHPIGRSALRGLARHWTHWKLARTIVDLVSGAYWFGAVPDFDTRFMVPYLRSSGQPQIGWGTVPWHYHLADAETFGAGMLRMPPPWSSDTISRLLGIPVNPAAKHTALGDARWVEQVYDTVIGQHGSTAEARAAARRPRPVTLADPL